MAAARCANGGIVRWKGHAGGAMNRRGERQGRGIETRVMGEILHDTG